MSVKLTLFSLGVVPPVAVMSVVYGRYMRSITRQVQDSLAGATQVSLMLETVHSCRMGSHSKVTMSDRCDCFGDCYKAAVMHK